jgi:putative ABC transport system substrate-binding protein
VVATRTLKRAAFFSILFVLSQLAAGWVAKAQQPALVRVGWLSAGKGSDAVSFVAFRAGLRDYGYIEGRNLILDPRWGELSNERTEQLATELLRTSPQVIVTQAGTAVFAMLRTGTTLPVVFGLSGDPVEAKLVDSLARPGRNFTGLSFLSLELVGKRVELLKEMAPSIKRIAILANPLHPGEKGERRASEAIIKALGLSFEYFEVRPGADMSDVLSAIAKSRSDAIVIFPDAGMLGQSEAIAAFAAKNRVPTISGWAEFAESGNLMTYGPNLREGYRGLAAYVDKILKGRKPADLPVELPKQFELVINLKTAKQIGLTIPPNLLVRANRVIK